MKLLIYITLLIAYSYAQDSGDGEVSYIPEDGPMHMVMHNLVTKCVHNNRSVTISPDVISLNFNDFKNNINVSFPIDEAGMGILNITGLNTTKKFIFLMSGFTKGFTTYSLGLIEESFKTMDAYVIFIDETRYTNIFQTKEIVINYEKAVKHVKIIGKFLANVFAILTNNGVSPTNIYVVGQGLATHLFGATGEYFEVLTGKKIGRITALDPTGPCYENATNHVKKGQATVVDIYHCNAFELGSSRNYGDVNVFVNNGVIQPKCFGAKSSGNSPSAAAAFCSHMSCWNFFSKTLSQPDIFPAFKCESYRQFKRGECKNSEQISAGYWMPTNASGNYYSSTGDNDIYQP